MKSHKYLLTGDYEEFFELSLATFLVLEGFKIEAFNRDPKNYPRVGFIFKKSKSLSTSVEKYLNNEVMVDPKLFSQKIREIKSHTKIFY